MPDAERLAKVPGALTARWHNIAVSFWVDAVTPAALRALRDSLDHVAALYPQGYAMLALVPTASSKVSPLSAEDRTLLVELLKKHEPNTRGVGFVIEAGGFVGAMTRSVLHGMGFVLRRPYPTATFDKRADAAAFLVPHAARSAGASFAPGSLVSFLDGLLPRA